METGKRASMREGPLAQLFRKTEDEPDAERKERKERPPAEPPRREPPPERETRAERSFDQRATEAARRAEERARRREQEARQEGGLSRYEGVPSPEERLRSVFSADIPENILDKAPEPTATREPAYAPEPPSYGMPSAGRVTEPMLRVVGVGGRRCERRQPHDRGRDRGRRVHGREHGHAVARAVGRHQPRAHRQRHHPRPGLGLEPRPRARRRAGGLRPPQEPAQGLRHGVRGRRLGRRHRHGRRACGGADRTRGRSA